MMNVINDNELKQISGGFDLTGTMVSAIIRGISSMLDLGRSLGTAIRRLSSNNLCRF
jgi:bacteriocin-like protein